VAVVIAMLAVVMAAVGIETPAMGLRSEGNQWEPQNGQEEWKEQLARHVV
jgi:hypothetical protein